MGQFDLLFFRPYDCLYCLHGFYGLGHMVDLANSIPGYTVHDLQRYDAEQIPTLNALSTYDPVHFYGFGHGNATTFTGNSTTPVFDISNCSVLAGRLVYLMSCSTAISLGPAIIANGGWAYAGFNITWTWVSLAPPIGDPYTDPFARGFYEAANELELSLLHGHTITQAASDSVDKYNYWIDYWIAHSDYYPLYAAASITYLAYDRDSLTILGDLNAALPIEIGLTSTSTSSTTTTMTTTTMTTTTTTSTSTTTLQLYDVTIIKNVVSATVRFL